MTSGDVAKMLGKQASLHGVLQRPRNLKPNAPGNLRGHHRTMEPELLFSHQFRPNLLGLLNAAGTISAWEGKEPS